MNECIVLVGLSNRSFREYFSSRQAVLMASLSSRVATSCLMRPRWIDLTTCTKEDPHPFSWSQLSQLSDIALISQCHSVMAPRRFPRIGRAR